jgi:hypothetical protein
MILRMPRQPCGASLPLKLGIYLTKTFRRVFDLKNRKNRQQASNGVSVELTFQECFTIAIFVGLIVTLVVIPYLSIIS